MATRRLLEKSHLITSSCLVLLLGLSACATNQEADKTIDEQQAQALQVPNTEVAQDKSDKVLVDQDVSKLLTLKERSDMEELANLQNELKNEELRQPANQIDVMPAMPLPAPVKEKEAMPHVDRHASHKAKPVEAAAISKEEITQMLYDADTVVVQKGDSLKSIAANHLGNKNEWKKILALNPDVRNPDKLVVGSKLFIPKNNFAARNVASVDNAKQIPVLKPTVKSKVAKAVKTAKETKAINKPAVKATPAPQASVTAAPAPTPVVADDVKDSPEVIESAFLPANTWNGVHTIDELLKEHLDYKKYIRFKGRLPVETLLERKTASKQDSEANGNELASATITAPKNLTRVVSYLGFLLLFAVLAGFFFTKPKNQ